MAIHAAAFNDSYEALVKFLCYAHVHEQMVNARDKNGNTPLILAAMAGKVNSIREPRIQIFLLMLSLRARG